MKQNETDLHAVITLDLHSNYAAITRDEVVRALLLMATEHLTTHQPASGRLVIPDSVSDYGRRTCGGDISWSVHVQEREVSARDG